MAINNFADVQNFFSTIDASQAAHANFWKQSDDPKVSYLAFVNGNVPGGSQTANPDTHQALPILIKGDGEHSNIIYALRGTANTFWDKNNPNSAFGQMPYNGPYFSDDQIDQLSAWITNGCPEVTPPPEQLEAK
jgi:hypothetical protein